MEKKAMTIREMGRMLGLGKTESYWVANKGWFEIVEIHGGRRVLMDSFERWYQSQTHYKKVDGGCSDD